ncbi:MAG: Transcriptional regulator, LysR family [Panacagrimonas sp.]|jgi:DNA-binding transcriptional LysR family regulator|nr:LysR family transcriptional regulator [Panacagrimonas sp.]MCC2657028.1 Transcriptional regulator, LysR family [Panacagrimonas sp.]
MKKIHESGPTLRRTDLSLLAVFDVVYRERNLTRAAHLLALSQSAVSHALARLRARLDDPLFVRHGRGVVPTPRAEQLAPGVQAALARLDEALRPGGGFEPARDLRRLTVAMADEIEPMALPQLMRALSAVAPRAQLSSVRVDRANLRADLVAGRIDLCVDVARATETEIAHAPWRSHRLCVVSARRRRLDIEAYLAADHIAVSSRRTGATMEEFALGRLGLQRRVALRCQNYEAACRVVVESGLLLTMPREQAEPLKRALGFFILPMPLELPPIEFHVYWHRRAESLPAVRWLREHLLAQVSRSAS